LVVRFGGSGTTSLYLRDLADGDTNNYLDAFRYRR